LAAIELAPQVRVNGIAPGVILPAGSRTSDYIQWRVQGIPVKQQGSTENISQAVSYILNNPFVNGQILFVDGGESLTNVGQNAVTYEQTTQIKQ
jgi:NAD(P)-dependent dehydrogenase (short-subunit alcohol dehydrogenase family)